MMGAKRVLEETIRLTSYGYAPWTIIDAADQRYSTHHHRPDLPRGRQATPAGEARSASQAHPRKQGFIRRVDC